jgi:hypothetical protein
MGKMDVPWDKEAIFWIAWGSSLIIPIKIWLIIRYVRRKMAEDEATAGKLPSQNTAFIKACYGGGEGGRISSGPGKE